MHSTLSLEILKKFKKHWYMLFKLFNCPIRCMIVFLFNHKEYEIEKKEDGMYSGSSALFFLIGRLRLQQGSGGDEIYCSYIIACLECQGKEFVT